MEATKLENLPETTLKASSEHKYILMHHCDIGDRSVHFSLDGLTVYEVKDLAAYLQFKAEKVLGDSVSLDNLTIVQFLENYGAKLIEKVDDFNPVGMFLIDMYSERESRLCGNNWYAENYDTFDSKYGDVATDFLINKSKGKDQDVALI